MKKNGDILWCVSEMRNLSGTVYFRGFVVFSGFGHLVRDKTALSGCRTTRVGTEEHHGVGAAPKIDLWVHTEEDTSCLPRA